MKEPYIWDNNIKIKTKEGKYDYEDETKEKRKVYVYNKSMENVEKGTKQTRK